MPRGLRIGEDGYYRDEYGNDDNDDYDYKGDNDYDNDNGDEYGKDDNKNADKRFIKLAFSYQSSTWLNRSTLLLTRQVGHSIGSDCRVRESHIWIFILLSSYNVDLVTSILIIFAHKFVFISLVS